MLHEQPPPDRPRVSVIVTCYNLGHYLDEAVDSILAQSLPDFEILIVDDGSTDPETCRLLADYERPRTRVLRSENRGLPAARNLGLVHTVAPYVCAVDADDRLEPSWLERGVTLLETNADVAFVSHWLRAFGDESWDWTPVRCDLGSLLDVNTVNGAAIVRRSVIDAVGGFDESLRDGCEDWEFWIRVTERGYRGAIIPEILYQYRRRPDSMSRRMNRGDADLRLYAQLVEKHPESYRSHLLDLVLRRERTFSELCRHIDSLEQELGTWLEPVLKEQCREVENARARLVNIAGRHTTGELREENAALEHRVFELVRERDAARGHVRELHQSLSWRLSAPLRRVYEWLGLAGTR